MYQDLTENQVAATSSPFIGKLTIVLSVSAENIIEKVSITNSRVQNIGRLLEGKTTDQAIDLIPKIFLLCSQAQQAASHSAIAHAESRTLSEVQLSEIATHCALEWLKEHSWQLWQMERELFGGDFAIESSLALSRYLINQLSAATKGTHAPSNNFADITQLLSPLLGCEPSQFSQLNWEEYLQWSRKSSAPYAQLISTLMQPEVCTFGAFSTWTIADEDGPLARQQTHPLVKQSIELWGASAATRTLARLVEMCAVCDSPRLTLAAAPGHALASRGTLIHHAVLDDQNVITKYSIDAPTERYFSQHGLVEKALTGQMLPSSSVKWARQLIWAIDPCVEFSVAFDKTDQPRTTEHA